MNMKKYDHKDRASQQAKLLIAREDFRSDVDAIRAKQSMIPSDFDKAINRLARKYKLGTSWTLGLKWYTQTLDPEKLIRRGQVDIFNKVDEKTGLSELWLRIDPDTTLEDIKERWQFVKRYQKMLDYAGKKKFQPTNDKVAERNTKAYELKQKGWKLKDIANELSTPSRGYNESEVSKMIKRHKARLDIN